MIWTPRSHPPGCCCSAEANAVQLNCQAVLYSPHGDGAKTDAKQASKRFSISCYAGRLRRWRTTASSQHPDGFSLRTQGARDADLASLAAGSAFGAGRPETRPADGPGRLNVREPESPDGLGRLSHKGGHVVQRGGSRSLASWTEPFIGVPTHTSPYADVRSSAFLPIHRRSQIYRHQRSHPFMGMGGYLHRHTLGTFIAIPRVPSSTFLPIHRYGRVGTSPYLCTFDSARVMMNHHESQIEASGGRYAQRDQRGTAIAGNASGPVSEAKFEIPRKQPRRSPKGFAR